MAKPCYQPSLTRAQRFRSLDGWRGICALLVVSHFGNDDHLRSLFFVRLVVIGIGDPCHLAMAGAAKRDPSQDGRSWTAERANGRFCPIWTHVELERL